MKKNYIKGLLLVCATLLSAVPTYADNISEAEAQAIAQEFFAGRSKQSGKPVARIAKQHNQDITSDNTSRSLYVFNNTNAQGFVVIAGEESMENKVLGYSDNGTFDYNDAPPALLWLLDSYTQEIAYMQQQGKKYEVRKSAFNKTTEPLIKTKWGQRTPYNNLCPKYDQFNRSITGCAATAMSQIMYYHKYPAKGYGSNSYISYDYGFEISEDFSNTTYEWDKMTLTYDSTSTQEACDAVAQIMYHAGVSINMDYGPSSGSTTQMSAEALIENFDYDKGLKYCNFDYYTLTEWETMIAENIDNKLPIFYSGVTKLGAGHAFIIDGYNSDGLVHVNWGWEGRNDGYFHLSTLDYEGDNNGYCYKQAAIFNIMPDKGTTTSEYEVTTLDFIIAEKEYNKNSKIEVTATEIQHTNPGKLVFTVGVKAEKEGDQTSKVYSLWDCNLEAGVLYTTQYSALELNDLTDGNYSLYLVYSIDNERTWKKVKMSIEGTQMYYARIEGDVVKISAHKLSDEDVYIYKKGEYPITVTRDKVFLQPLQDKYYVAISDTFNTGEIDGTYQAQSVSGLEGAEDESWEINLYRDNTNDSIVWLHPIFKTVMDLSADDLEPVYATYDAANGTLEMPMGQCIYGSDDTNYKVVLGTVDEDFNEDTTATVTFYIENDDFVKNITTTTLYGAGDAKNNRWWFQAYETATFSTLVGYDVEQIDSISTILTLQSPTLSVEAPDSTRNATFDYVVTTQYATQVATILLTEDIDMDYADLFNGEYSATITAAEYEGSTLNFRSNVITVNNYLYVAATNKTGEIVGTKVKVEYVSSGALGVSEIAGSYRARGVNGKSGNNEAWSVTITADSLLPGVVWIQPICEFGGITPQYIKPVKAYYDDIDKVLSVPLGQRVYGDGIFNDIRFCATFNSGIDVDTVGDITAEVEFLEDSTINIIFDPSTTCFMGVADWLDDGVDREFWWKVMHSVVFTNAQFTNQEIVGTYTATSLSKNNNTDEGTQNTWTVNITADAGEPNAVWLHPILTFGGLTSDRIDPIKAIYDNQNNTLSIELGQYLTGTSILTATTEGTASSSYYEMEGTIEASIVKTDDGSITIQFDESVVIRACENSLFEVWYPAHFNYKLTLNK